MTALTTRPAARTAPGTPSSPPATRTTRPSWRDPRLALGLLLVCGSVLLGARVLAGADDTVAVLAAARPLAAGEQLTSGDVEVVRLRFDDAADADRYLPGDVGAVAGTVVGRPVGTGELVPRAALGTSGGRLAELPLAVDPARVPGGVRTGAVVDVWVVPAAGQQRTAEQLLAAVPVLSTARAGGASGARQLVVGIPGDDEDEVRRVVSGLHEEAALLVVARPGTEGQE